MCLICMEDLQVKFIAINRELLSFIVINNILLHPSLIHYVTSVGVDCFFAKHKQALFTISNTFKACRINTTVIFFVLSHWLSLSLWLCPQTSPRRENVHQLLTDDICCQCDYVSTQTPQQSAVTLLLSVINLSSGHHPLMNHRSFESASFVLGTTRDRLHQQRGKECVLGLCMCACARARVIIPTMSAIHRGTTSMLMSHICRK